jgi:hypothetical protein
MAKTFVRGAIFLRHIVTTPLGTIMILKVGSVHEARVKIGLRETPCGVATEAFTCWRTRPSQGVLQVYLPVKTEPANISSKFEAQGVLKPMMKVIYD